MRDSESSGIELREITLHGHRVSYRQAGRGPVILLIHGITGDSATWDTVMPWLAEDFTVIAPDLLGHGESAKPRGDYSLGAFASGLRDLLIALGHERATVVGHSLGGGVAMQLSYQFPERCERLVLVSSGGLGREVHAVLRSAALPGAEWVLPLLAGSGTRRVGALAAGLLGRVGLRAGTDLEEMARGFASLGDVETRQAFLRTLRGIIDPGGQSVSASDRLYLASHIPTLIVWGRDDRLIPMDHGLAAHRQIPGSRFEAIAAGHYPHRDDPRRFVAVLREFVEESDPAQVDPERFRSLLLAGRAGQASPRAGAPRTMPPPAPGPPRR